jgi:urease accessory protein
VELVRGRSVVVASSAQSPLQLLNPSNEGAGAWVYLASLGGGFVGDDALALEVEVKAGAMLLLSAQASTKVYRGSRASFAMRARVEAGATVVVWPPPVSCFSGARLEQVQRLELASDASVLLVDAFTAGRVANGERWSFEGLSSRLSVDVEGTPWLREAVQLDGEHGGIAERMHGLDAFATVVMRGPRFSGLARTLTAGNSAPGRVLVTASARDEGAVVRVAAPTVEGLLSELERLLRSQVNVVLGDSVR